MPKYINADNLVSSGRDFLQGVFFVSKGGQQSGKTLALVEELLRHMIRSAPAEDVEPVVRCKDCENRMKNDWEDLWWCRCSGYKCNDDNWYCAGGKRRITESDTCKSCCPCNR